jgi:hypothetical protein
MLRFRPSLKSGHMLPGCLVSNHAGSVRHPLRSFPMPVVFIVPVVFVVKLAAEAAIWSLFFGR